MQTIMQMPNASPQGYRKQKLYNGVMKMGHLMILNAVQDM